MKFSVFIPPTDGTGPLPALFYLAGLTCNEETFPSKAGAQRFAAEHGLMLIAPDTSPRGADIDGELQDWTYGAGAGFYVDATRAPWQRHYAMESYVCEELYDIAVTELNADAGRIGIFGHSMGGHGALVLALRHPQRFKSVSAFAPIVHPVNCPWGRNAFSHYFGPEAAQASVWRQHDATELILERGPLFPGGILIDQGLGDKFLAEQLMPDVFASACERVGQPLTLRRHAGYDHGYYFISTFMADHIEHHARRLRASPTQ
jgi:S-formylglutathione hydrolase